MLDANFVDYRQQVFGNSESGMSVDWFRVKCAQLRSVENEGEAARLLTLRISRHVSRRQFDREVLSLVIVVDPRGDVANCLIVIGMFERLQYQNGGMSLEAKFAGHIR
jgi:hypothetical protein